jgi:broad specificity phosphatase PhoE
MKTYYIFRHGETFATLKNSGYGLRRLTAGILESGKPTIEAMAQYLKTVPTDINLTSPLTRCRQTAQIITLITGKKFKVDWGINEMLEPFPLLRLRLKNFLVRAEGSPYNTFLICTHGACIAGLTALLTKDEFKAEGLFVYPKPGVLFKIEDGKVEEFDFNIK